MAALCLLPMAPFAAEVTVAVVNAVRLQTEAHRSQRCVRRFGVEFAARASPGPLHNRSRSSAREAVARPRQDERRGGQSLQRDIRSRTLRLENAKERAESDRRLRQRRDGPPASRTVEVMPRVAKAESLDIVLESGVTTWASDRANITEKRYCCACVSSIRQPRIPKGHPMGLTLQELAEAGGAIAGDPGRMVDQAATLQDADEGAVSSRQSSLQVVSENPGVCGDSRTADVNGIVRWVAWSPTSPTWPMLGDEPPLSVCRTCPGVHATAVVDPLAQVA